MSTKTLGPVGFNLTGEYNNTKAYEKLDVVYYEGSSYVAKTDSIGQLPTNTEYWDCIANGYPNSNGNKIKLISPDGNTTKYLGIDNNGELQLFNNY